MNIFDESLNAAIRIIEVEPSFTPQKESSFLCFTRIVFV